MSNRRKPILCVLCKTAKTYNMSAVCAHCTRLNEEAENIIRDANISLSSDGKVLALVNLDVSAYCFNAEKIAAKMRADDIARDIGKLCLEFAQHGQIEQVGTDWDRSVNLDSDEEIVISIGHDVARIKGRYIMTGEQAMILKKIHQLLANMNLAAFEEGKRKGVSILRSLANNELSVNDLNSEL